MDKDKADTWAYWLKLAAKILSYFAAAITGGIVSAGCKNGALINLC